MKRIIEHKTILFDLDNTLLDFAKAEDYAIRKLALELEIVLTEQEVQTYKKINTNYWHLSDSGKMPKGEILKRRFIDFFSLFNIEVDGKWCDETFRSYLAEEVFLVRDAIYVLDELVKEHDLYIVSNGVKKTQHIRIKKAGIEKYFKNVFLSDEIGHAKPEKEFFDYVISNIPNFNYEDTVLIGDNLYSDINGANNSKIKSVYFNFYGEENKTEYKPIYEIKSLMEVLK